MHKVIGGSVLCAAIVLAFASSAQASQIIGFGQNSSSNTVTLSNPTASTTAIAINTAVTITNYAGGGTPIVATLVLNATSTSPLTTSGLLFDQHFTGTFSITGGGNNYLSGTVVDDLSGTVGGSSMTFSATTPPSGNVTFTSSILTLAQLGLERAFSLSFSNDTPVNAICNPGATATLCAATASFTGTASANNTPTVPEPATLGLIGIALAALGFAARRKQA